MTTKFEVAIRPLQQRTDPHILTLIAIMLAKNTFGKVTGARLYIYRQNH